MHHNHTPDCCNHLCPGLTLVGCLAVCTIVELLSMWNLTRIEVHLCNMLSPEAPNLSLATYNWGLVSILVLWRDSEFHYGYPYFLKLSLTSIYRKVHHLTPVIEKLLSKFTILLISIWNKFSPLVDMNGFYWHLWLNVNSSVWIWRD